MEELAGRRIVLFDGVCNLCNRLVRWVVKRDPRKRFEFAPSQWAVSNSLIGEREADPSTVMLIEDGKIYERSDAVLRICKRLRFPWPLVYAFVVIPRPLREWVYRWIAGNRYRWFGKRESCMTPSAEMQSRFLEEDSVSEN